MLYCLKILHLPSSDIYVTFLIAGYYLTAKYFHAFGSVFSREELSIDEPARPAIKRAGSAVGNSVLNVSTASCYFIIQSLFPTDFVEDIFFLELMVMRRCSA
jgi:hypothetical protein